MRIAEICEQESLFADGEIEIDESYFGARRTRGMWGRGALGKKIDWLSGRGESVQK